MDIDCHEFDDTPKIKIVLLGDRSVGKSSIVKRFIRNEFDANQNVFVPVIQPTIGIDYMSKMMQYNNKKYKLELWDTAGQEKYRSLVKNYLKDADCALFVYDVNGSYELTVDSRTYNHIPDWLSTFKEATNRESVCLIVGNKIDVKKQQGSQSNAAGSQQYSEWQGLEQFEVSAKIGNNINELFCKVIENIVARNILSTRFLPGSVNLLNGAGSKITRCCGRS